MIIVKFSGGIGNQLFQYAAGLRIAIRNRTELKADLSSYSTDDLRQFRLHVFDVRLEQARRLDYEPFKKLRIYGKRHMPLLLLERLGVIHLPRTYTHLCPSFFPKLLKAGRHSLLNGYWQSEEYFRDISTELRRNLEFVAPLPKEVQQLANEIAHKKCLSVHIRRGDYVANSTNLSNHGVCSVNYYKEALTYFQSRYEIDQVLIFSDDIPWVKENLPIGLPHIYASSISSEDYQDLYLMQHCIYHIIANSSFSWWGAWLSQADPLHIIAPKQWFANPSYDSSRIVPTNWHRI